MSIKLTNISHSYNLKDYVLQNFNLEINEKELFAIVGPSGSGKSTLLNIVGGKIRPTRGSVFINGTDINKFTPKEFETFKLENVGCIFKELNLIPYLNVLENVLLSAILLNRSKKLYRERALNLLEKLELKDKAHNSILQLSEYEKQKIAMARALLLSPRVILADEPTGNLDRKNSDDFIEKLKSITSEENISVLIVTDDLKINEYADRVIYIDK